MRSTCECHRAQRDQQARHRGRAVALREQTAVHRHRLRAVFAQMQRAQPAVAAQRVVGVPVRLARRVNFVASHATTRSSRHIARGAGSGAATPPLGRLMGAAAPAPSGSTGRSGRRRRARPSAPIARSTGSDDVASRPNTSTARDHADQGRVQRAARLGGIVDAALEEQRVVQAEPRGEGQRDEVEQRQRDRRRCAATRARAASRATSARSRARRGGVAERDRDGQREQQQGDRARQDARAIARDERFRRRLEIEQAHGPAVVSRDRARSRRRSCTPDSVARPSQSSSRFAQHRAEACAERRAAKTRRA